MTTPVDARRGYQPFVIGNINAGEGRWELFGELFKAAASPLLAGIIRRTGGPYLDQNRNLVLEAWIESTAKADVLIFMDSDVVTDFQSLARLAASCTPERPVVAGVYHSILVDHDGRLNNLPVIYDWSHDHHGHMRLMPVAPAYVDLCDEDDPDRFRIVDAAGTGLLAIHRRIVNDMADIYGPPMPWFNEHDIRPPDNSPPVRMGEDFAFCLRVHDMGHRVYVDRTVHGDHFKTTRITRPSNIDYRSVAALTSAPAGVTPT
jgi:hypothetical protein